MLETTSFSLHLCRFLYSVAFGYFVLTGSLGGLYFLRFRERFASRHFVLSLLLVFYSLSSLIYTFGSPSAGLNRILISAIYILGPTIFLTYIGVISQVLYTKPRWLPYMLLPLRFLAISITADLFLYFGFGHSFFFTEGPQNGVRNWYLKMIGETLTIEPTLFLVLLPAMISLIATSVLILVQYRKTLRRERFLKVGLISIVAFHIPDFSIMLFDPPKIFPIAFLGYTFEALRFNLALVENYLRGNERMRQRLKDSLLNFAQVRLSKQILHDVKSIRRNLLYSLEQVKEPSTLPEILKSEINRLQIYEGGGLQTPKELINLEEIVHTTATLFEREFQMARLKLGYNIPSNLTIRASRNDMLIVLINLIQNSIEALATCQNPWIQFEAFEKSDTVILEISDAGMIPPEESAQIFKPGYSGKGSSRGLGLNIVQESLAANNSLITLRSDRKNTTFQIEFPKF
jgi:signal transduction histidine kinase